MFPKQLLYDCGTKNHVEHAHFIRSNVYCGISKTVFSLANLGFETQFEKFTDEVINSYNIDYDYSSIMHYSATAFAKKRGLVTIEPRPKRDVKFGQREHLSTGDIRQARAMYGCEDTEFIATPVLTTAQKTQAPTTASQTSTSAKITIPQVIEVK